MTDSHTKAMLDLAARLACRARGYVEPNPLVGAVITSTTDDGEERIIGLGHHRRFGDIHAELDALMDCARRGEDPRGGTLYVTLEPCNAQGKQPPCVDAILKAGIAKVICARRDPHPKASGGLARLIAHGVQASFSDLSPAATRLSDPFLKRITTDLPWVIVKWAQTIDGRVGTRTGESKWISCDRSRRRVHAERAKVDAILTAIGTVLADDPILTSRSGHTRRRIARRCVIDPDLEIPPECRLLQTLDEAPLTIFCTDEALLAKQRLVSELSSRHVEIISVGRDGEVRVHDVLQHLVTVHQATNVLVEAGPGLMGRLIDADLADELHVYIAPIALADDQARPALRGRAPEALADAKRFTLDRVKRIEDDVMMVYRRTIVE